jgi:peptidoglycan/xylan/chitin deacetylase (PgdA/CDA1 family)
MKLSFLSVAATALVLSLLPTVTLAQAIIPSSNVVLPQQSFSFAPFTKSNLLKQGGIAFNFDDGNSSVFQNALPVLNLYNIKGTFGILGLGNTKYDYGSGHYASDAAIKAASKQGHVMASHSMNHFNLTTLNQQDLEFELKSSKDYLQNLIGAQVNHFIAPYCAINDTTLNTVKKYYNTVSICGGVGNNTTGFNPFAVDRKMVEAKTTLSEITLWIKEAKAKKQLLVLTFHHVGYKETEDQNISIVKLRQIIQLTLASKMPIGTTEQAVKLLK